MGVVPGGGFRLIALSSLAEHGNPQIDSDVRPRERSEAPNEAGREPFAAIVLSDVEPDEIDERPPLPIAGESQPGIGETADNDAEVIVTGFVCSRGHFNSPDAAYCGVCGIAMVQLTRRPVEDIRPPLGYLVVDDGSTFLVNRDYVVGREPEPTPACSRVEPRRSSSPTETRSSLAYTRASCLTDGK